MPFGAERLNPLSSHPEDEIPALTALKSCVRIASDSDTGLRWQDDYNHVRAKGGEVAGCIVAARRTHVVTARGFSLHCRHAIWMLANDKAIPIDHDVSFADENWQNLSPDNLVLTNKYAKPVAAPAKRTTERVPEGFVFTPAPYHEAGPVLVAIVLRGRHFPLYVALDHSRAWASAFIAADALGLAKGASNLVAKYFTKDQITTIRLATTLMFEPVPEKRTPSEHERVRRFNAQLMLIGNSIRQERENNITLDPEPTAAETLIQAIPAQPPKPEHLPPVGAEIVTEGSVTTTTRFNPDGTVKSVHVVDTAEADATAHLLSQLDDPIEVSKKEKVPELINDLFRNGAL